MEQDTMNDGCDFSTDLLIDDDFDSLLDEELPDYIAAIGDIDRPLNP